VDLFSFGTKVNELVSQIFQVDDDQLFDAIKLTKIVDAFGIVTNAEPASSTNRRHAKCRILKTSEALK